MPIAPDCPSGLVLSRAAAAVSAQRRHLEFLRGRGCGPGNLRRIAAAERELVRREGVVAGIDADRRAAMAAGSQSGFLF